MSVEAIKEAMLKLAAGTLPTNEESVKGKTEVYPDPPGTEPKKNHGLELTTSAEEAVKEVRPKLIGRNFAHPVSPQGKYLPPPAIKVTADETFTQKVAKLLGHR